MITELIRPKTPASVGGGFQRAVKSSMDSANIQRGLNPPLNEVSFNAGGLSNREIADRLGLTANTVKGYIKNIYGKLGANRRVQVAARAKELGLLSPEQVLSSRSL